MRIRLTSSIWNESIRTSNRWQVQAAQTTNAGQYITHLSHSRWLISSRIGVCVQSTLWLVLGHRPYVEFVEQLSDWKQHCLQIKIDMIPTMATDVKTQRSVKYVHRKIDASSQNVADVHLLSRHTWMKTYMYAYYNHIHTHEIWMFMVWQLEMATSNPAIWRFVKHIAGRFTWRG